jgi:amino acid transporter
VCPSTWVAAATSWAVEVRGATSHCAARGALRRRLSPSHDVLSSSLLPGINFNFTTGMATTSDGAMISTDSAALQMTTIIYPPPQGIAPTVNGRNGAMFFSFIIFMGTMFSSILNSIAASRFIYSFARDSGFPPLVNDLLKQVHPKTGSPLWAIFVFMCGSLLFCVSWTNKSPTVAFSAVSGINAIGFLTVYGMPSLLRFTTAVKFFKPSAGFNLGKLSIPIAILGMLYGQWPNSPHRTHERG